MTATRFHRAKALFLQACEMEPDEWRVYLEAACDGDGELYEEVATLLKHHDPSEPTGSAGSPPPPPESSRRKRFEPGDVVASRYRIVSLLGQGGMGEVYRADDIKLGQTVALKFLSPLFAFDPHWLGRLHTEVRIARGVTHPNVCRVYDIAEAESGTFVSMEYIDGEDLSMLLRRIGRLPRRKATEVARQLCEALSAAHDCGVVHRDIKPANIMIDGRGRARITDFGIAASIDSSQKKASAAGTPGYMAPEQHLGEPATTRSDIYSLGLVLYELFTGHRPFGEPVLPGDPAGGPLATPPTQFVPDLDRSIEDLLLRCLNPDPEGRPASARELMESLPSPLQQNEIHDGTTATIAGMRNLTTAPMSRRRCMAWGTMFLGGLVGALVLAVVSGPLEQLGVALSPSQFEERAEAILQTGRKGAPGNTMARGFFQEKGTGNSQQLSYWYRKNDAPILPRTVHTLLGSSWATPDDPLSDQLYMVQVILDGKGRLRNLEAHSSTYDPDEALNKLDWRKLLIFAGLDPDAFLGNSTEEKSEGSRSSVHWTGPDPDHPSKSLTASGIVMDGMLMYFDLASPEEDSLGFPGETDQAFPDPWTGVLALFSLGILLGLPSSRPLFERRRATAGRAFRAACILFLLGAGSRLVGADHAFHLEYETDLIYTSVSLALSLAVIAWFLYTYFEPTIRSALPSLFTGWSRLLERQFRHRGLGREIVIGCAFGTTTAFLAWTPVALGFDSYLFPSAADLNGALAANRVVAHLMDTLLGSVLATLIASLVLGVAQKVLKVPAAVMASFAFLASLALGLALGVSGIPGFLAVLAPVTLLTICLWRLGILAGIAATYGFAILIGPPVNLGFASWAVLPSLAGLASLLLLFGWGAAVAIGGGQGFREETSSPLQRPTPVVPVERG